MKDQKAAQIHLDRIEGDYFVAVACDGTRFDLPRCVLPFAQEGDYVNLTVDEQMTARMREEIKQLEDELFQ
ncbi:MAG: DUF3006 domain-containing protein [Clostridia bacterium]|nr:DUF3006 domain-containing protein [Clostridia bacterium]